MEGENGRTEEDKDRDGKVREREGPSERRGRGRGHAEILMYDHFYIHIMLNCRYHIVQLYAYVLVKASIAVILLVIY